MTEPLPRTLNGRYRLEAKLGAGGMGTVFRATDLVIGREVAVKLLAEDSAGGPIETKRILREAQSVAKLKDPHIVTLFDVGEIDGAPFLVMELVDGETLHDRLARDGRLPYDRAIDLARQLAAALQRAHDQGLVHRDVKPGNIMIGARGGKDHVTLLDFGIAKPIDGKTALTDPGLIVGTIEYMAPEQITGGSIDGRADQYALACVLVRAISGSAPFHSDNVASLIHQRLSTAAAHLKESVPAVPDYVDAAVARALMKDPAARFPTMLDFASALGGERAAVETRARSGAFELEDVNDVAQPSLELDRRAGPTPAKIESLAPRVAMTAPVVRDASTAPVESEPVRTGFSGAITRIPTGIWKRICAYSALALILSNACFRFSATSTITLFVGVLLGAIGLYLHLRTEKQERSQRRN